MSYFEKNSEILKQKYPNLLEELTVETDENLAEEDIKVETAQSGEPTLCVKGIYVHSNRDPVREGQRIAQASDTGGGPVIVLGFGLGYAAISAAEFGRPVIIIEKYRNLILKALELKNFTEFLSRPGIIFIIGDHAGDLIINALAIASEISFPDSQTYNTDEKPKLSVIRNKALSGLDEAWYKEVEAKIHTWSMKDKVNADTRKRFGRRWIRNLSRNMKAIRDYPGVSFLSGVAAPAQASSGIPVFLGAAGPSLDRVIPVLREIQRRCIVVAVDTSLRFFLRNEVIPDFVLVVDPQFWNSRHLDRCSCEKTVLVAESAVYPPVLNLPFKKIFLCGSLFPLGEFIEKQVDPKGRLGAGGSVATTAWDFARSLGASKVWIAGLDLGYPGNKTHYRGARFEERLEADTFRLNTGETWVTRALHDGIPFKAPCALGGQVLTDRRLSLYAAWFENQFGKYENVKSYGLFQEGLSITGLRKAEADDILSLPDRREEIDKQLEKTFEKVNSSFFAREEKQKRDERYKNAVSALIQGLENIKKAADEGVELIERSLKYNANQSEQGKIIGKLDKITRRIAQSEVKEVAGFLFDKTEKEDSDDPFRAYLKSSLSLFTLLSEAVNFNLDNIAKNS